MEENSESVVLEALQDLSCPPHLLHTEVEALDKLL